MVKLKFCHYSPFRFPIDNLIYKHGLQNKLLLKFQENVHMKVVDIFIYSQTCPQRPPLGPQKSGRCSKVKA